MISKRRSLARRTMREKRFKAYGLFCLSLTFLLISGMTLGLLWYGYTAFYRAEIKVSFPVGSQASPRDLLEKMVDQEGASLLSGASELILIKRLQQKKLTSPPLQEIGLPLHEEVDACLKGLKSFKSLEPFQEKKINVWKQEKRLAFHFNEDFFFSADSREPEKAGMAGALIGTLYTLIVTFIIAFPLGVVTAVYLEEFAPKNQWTHLIEVNMTNLASVPSIIFGLLGLAVFINYMDLPRSSSLVGGLTLSLITLPVIVIATRSALQAVPRSIRQGALALGASDVQVTFHHVLPLAMPGILTGTLLGLSRALGESAPLLIIGMVAFVADIPQTLFDPATTLPVQIFSWTKNPESSFMPKAAGGILSLLVLLIGINGIALKIRHTFEKKR